ncbi:tRNA modification GTPase [Yersinia ruckeri]|uniref:tRNA modification GTPase n=1 Tax=Yersinia ruckeri TaxID=29486 RepID=UPI0020C02B4E|nr:tRNA modification GTPase [Yersinia ruckeri]MCK8556766.1 tRNA modification GTPase [Yersinia ruckeri]MCK8586602.1 tRNA modification GTPase [Yersinia ruckeri]
MSDEIKQIAALIGHQQAQEKRVAALIDEFQKESAQLSLQTAQLSQVIRELDSASGNMTETVKKSVNTALNQVERELKQAGFEQQKPAVNALNQVVKAANDSVNALRSEMLQYRWKSIAYIAIAMLAVMGGCLWGMYYFIDSGYARIAEMQKMESMWERKAPLANIITCEGQPCVQVIDERYTNKNGDVFYKIHKVK